MVRELGLLEFPDAKLGVTLSQLHGLLEISRSQSITVGELGKALNVDKSVASRLLASLDEWVTTKAAPDDSRRKLFFLTKSGKEKVKEIDGYCGDATAKALTLLSWDDQNRLEAALVQYVGALKRARSQKTACYRPFKKSDEKAIVKIVTEVDEEFGIKRGERPRISLEPFKSKGALYIVAELDAKVCGGGGILPRGGGSVGECELQLLYLKPAARGLGIGQQLLSDCLKAASRAGYQFCYALTSDRFKGATDLYERNGFNKVPHEGWNKRSSCNRLYVKEL